MQRLLGIQLKFICKSSVNLSVNLPVFECISSEISRRSKKETEGVEPAASQGFGELDIPEEQGKDIK